MASASGRYFPAILPIPPVVDAILAARVEIVLAFPVTRDCEGPHEH
jgi:hypothetical protein